MGKLLQGCAVAALIGTMGGQAFAQSHAVYVAPAPLMAPVALNTNDEFTGPPDAPLPAGMRNGTLDAQYVRLQAAHMQVAEADTAPPQRIDAAYTGPSAPGPSAPSAADQAPAEGPGFTLAPRLLDAASAFDDYMTAAAQVRAQFADGGQVAKVVDVGAGYEARQLQAGAIAYAALVALNDPDFVAQVRAQGREMGGSSALADELLSAPQNIMGVPGAARTAAKVAAVLRERGYGVLGAGKAVKQSAYDVQHQAWSRAFVADPQGVLARVKSDSAQTTRADGARVQRLLRISTADTPVQAGAGARSGVVTHGLALAALTVLGQTDERGTGERGAGETETSGRFDLILNDALMANCLKMAKLNLYQCMAVAGPQYEDLFCVGQHAMMDTGACMISAADDDTAAPPVILRTADAADGEMTERQAIERGYGR